MKMNKIIIPAAALAMGVALVGSVSSTLAWYQYSTKAQAAFIGTSIGKSESLEIRTSTNKWKSNLSTSEVNALAGIASVADKNLIPITTGEMTATSALPTTGFYSGIETGTPGYKSGNADTSNFVQIPLDIRYKQVESDTPEYVAKKLQLIDLTIESADDSLDLYKAVRVHFSMGGNNLLFARDNSAGGSITTQTWGNLDTDNDGAIDKEFKYEWETPTDVDYGIKNSNQVAYNTHVANFKYDLGNLGTSESGTRVTVTIWIEGWQQLSNFPNGNADATSGKSSMWDASKYNGADFRVGMRFQAVDAN